MCPNTPPTPAPRWRQPWTPAEDALLLTGQGTRLDRAVRLSRTPAAVDMRLRHLRTSGGRMGP